MSFNLRIAADGKATVGGNDVKVVLPKQVSVKPSGMFVPSLRWISKTRLVAIVERPPMRMQVHYANQMKSEALADGGRSSRLYSIPLPWTQYRIQLDGRGLSIASIAYSISPESIKSVDDTVYYLPLPNTSSGSSAYRTANENDRVELTWICSSSSRPNITDMTLSESILAGINNLWLSGFNNNAGSYAHHGAFNELPNKYKHLSQVTGGSWTPYLDAIEKLSLREMIEVTPYLKTSCRFGQLLHEGARPGHRVKSFINACYV